MLAFIGFVLVFSLSAQQNYNTGKILENLSIKSKVTGQEHNYSVYLPPGYEHSQRSYPVLYLLHGYSDNETAWTQFGEVQQTVNRAIAKREIPPMIIVMPDAKVTWYINSYDGKNRYEDMFFQEFIPQIEKEYRIRSNKEFRAVSGLSMGGYGALVWAIKHSEIFGACAAFSAAVYTNNEITDYLSKGEKEWFTNVYGNQTDRDELPAHWAEYSVLHLVNEMSKKELDRVKYYIDCGDDDFLFRGNAALHIAMREKGVRHEYRVRNGKHNWTYWRSNLIHGLKFVGDVFRR